MYKCNKCNKNYKSKGGLYKHISIKHQYIENDGNNEIIKNDNINDNVDSDVIEVYDNTVNNTNNNITAVQNNSTLQNNSNNTLQNNSNNNTTNNFYIYPHGKENLSLIDKDDIYDFLKNFNCITDYTKLVHCNKKYPQHHSICKTNKKDKYISVYDKSSKTLKTEKNIDDILQEQLKNGCNNIKIFLKQCDKNISKEIKEQIEDNIKRIKKYMELAPSDRFRKMITFELGMVLYNNRELINQTWRGNLNQDYLNHIEEKNINKNYNQKNIDKLFINNNNSNKPLSNNSSDSLDKEESDNSSDNSSNSSSDNLSNSSSYNLSNSSSDKESDSSSNSSSDKESDNLSNSSSDKESEKNKKKNKSDKKILFYSSAKTTNSSDKDTTISSKKYNKKKDKNRIDPITNDRYVDTTNEEADKEIEEISKVYEFLKKKKFDKEKLGMLMRMLTP
jgi:hypothetical protein